MLQFRKTDNQTVEYKEPNQNQMDKNKSYLIEFDTHFDWLRLELARKESLGSLHFMKNKNKNLTVPSNKSYVPIHIFLTDSTRSTRYLKLTILPVLKR